MTTEPYTRKLRHAAIVAVIYHIAELSVLGWLLWHGEYTHATAWFVGTAVVWKWFIDPLFVEPSVTGPYR